MKRKVQIAALEWDDFVLQEQLKSLMYVYCSLRGDPKKYKLIDELNFKNCVRLKRKTTSKLFVGITYKKESLLFIHNILMPTISSHIHLFRISNINQTWFSTCQYKWIYHIKNRYWRKVSYIKYTKYYASIAIMVK